MIYAIDLRAGNKFRSTFGKAETVLSVIDNTNNGKIRVLTKDEYEAGVTPGYASEMHRDMYSHLILCKENGNQYKPCEISGEPLTEEWLIKFGAHMVDEGEFHKDWKVGSPIRIKVRYKKDTQKYLIAVWDGDQNDEMDCAIIWLDFVHELQNAYRLIMRAELKEKQ